MDCHYRLLGRFLVAPQRWVDCSRQVNVWHVGTRIRLYPKLAGLFGFFEVAGDSLMVDRRNEILFRLARAVAYFVCLPSIVCSATRFSNRGESYAQPCVV